MKFSTFIRWSYSFDIYVSRIMYSAQNTKVRKYFNKQQIVILMFLSRIDNFVITQLFFLSREWKTTLFKKLEFVVHCFNCILFLISIMIITISSLVNQYDNWLVHFIHFSHSCVFIVYKNIWVWFYFYCYCSHELCFRSNMWHKMMSNGNNSSLNSRKN